MDRIFLNPRLPPPNSYVEAPAPGVMVLGGGISGRYLVMKVEPSRMGSVPLEETGER